MHVAVTGGAMRIARYDRAALGILVLVITAVLIALARIVPRLVVIAGAVMRMLGSGKGVVNIAMQPLELLMIPLMLSFAREAGRMFAGVG